MKLPFAGGVIVSDVAPGSPADVAGVKVMDIIMNVDGITADTLPAIGTRLFMRRGGEKIKLSVIRGKIDSLSKCPCWSCHTSLIGLPI